MTRKAIPSKGFIYFQPSLLFASNIRKKPCAATVSRDSVERASFKRSDLFVLSSNSGEKSLITCTPIVCLLHSYLSDFFSNFCLLKDLAMSPPVAIIIKLLWSQLIPQCSELVCFVTVSHLCPLFIFAVRPKIRVGGNLRQYPLAFYAAGTIMAEKVY
jgi:hypothetical protein